ncbi:MAG TPA: hypothetical protein VKT72_00160 [Candidatus Baltobacteraceae bacterium]|nr:hypothetical protein [Candidatus Baltobacteraceae bacterium]
MKLAIPISLLAAFSVIAPLGAAAQTSGNEPVAINACGPILNGNNTQNLFGVPVASSSSGIKIQFTNESPKTANLINFAVKSNGDSFVIRDVGTFSPGIEITHKFTNGSGQAFVLPQFVAPKISCRVQSVGFTDGTVWRRGQTQASVPAGASANPLTASPQSVSIDSNAEQHLFMVMSSEKIAAFSEQDTCKGIAAISLAASGESAATYSVKPIAPGTCSVAVRDQAGNNIMVPITVR